MSQGLIHTQSLVRLADLKSGYQAVQIVRALPLRDVFHGFYIIGHALVHWAPVIAVVHSYRLIYYDDIDYRARVKKRTVNKKRAVGFVATYCISTIIITTRVVDSSINLIYINVIYLFLSTLLQTLLTRNRRKAELTGIKWMVRFVVIYIFYRYCWQLSRELVIVDSLFVMCGWSTCLTWCWEGFRLPCFRQNRRKLRNSKV